MKAAVKAVVRAAARAVVAVKEKAEIMKNFDDFSLRFHLNSIAEIEEKTLRIYRLYRLLCSINQPTTLADP